MRWMVFLLAVCLSAVLSGCGTLNIPEGYDLAAHPDRAVVVMSVTHDRAPFRNRRNASGISIGLQLLEVSTGDEVKWSEEEFGEFPFGEEMEGQMMVLSLPPGAYSLAQVDSPAVLGVIGTEATRTVVDIRPGVIYYLGNLHVELNFQTEYELMPVGATGVLVPMKVTRVKETRGRLSDRSQRDLALFRDGFPKMVNQPVRMALFPVGMLKPVERLPRSNAGPFLPPGVQQP